MTIGLQTMSGINGTVARRMDESENRPSPNDPEYWPFLMTGHWSMPSMHRNYETDPSGRALLTRDTAILAAHGYVRESDFTVTNLQVVQFVRTDALGTVPSLVDPFGTTRAEAQPTPSVPAGRASQPSRAAGAFWAVVIIAVAAIAATHVILSPGPPGPPKRGAESGAGTCRVPLLTPADVSACQGAYDLVEVSDVAGGRQTVCIEVSSRSPQDIVAALASAIRDVRLRNFPTDVHAWSHTPARGCSGYDLGLVNEADGRARFDVCTRWSAAGDCTGRERFTVALD